MNTKVIAVIIFFITNFNLCKGRKYTNYSLIKIKPKRTEHMKYLRGLESQRYMDIKFWDRPFSIGSSVEVIVSPVDLGLFRERAAHYRLKYKVLMTDLQRAFDNQSITAYTKLRPDTFSFEHFHNLGDIYQWLTDLAQNKSYPLTYMTIGKSVEGRDISMINIDIDPTIPKKKVIVEGGIHGHEWASIVFVTYLIHELANAEKCDNVLWKQLARSYNWYLVPVANPDGFDYTHKEDRLWRKNRSPVANFTFGVDLNRNFDVSFCKYASSREPPHENYCGPKPFSEPETKALSFFATSNHKDLKYYFSIHAYGQRILIPHDDRVPHVDNYMELENYGRQAVRKIYLQHNVKYATGTSYDTTGGRMSGTSATWVKKYLKVKYAYTILLRDRGAYGYALPSDQLLPMCEETTVMMTELMTATPRHVRALYSEDSANIQVASLLFITLGFCFTWN